MELFMVKDTRNGHLIGPYDKLDAKILAENLNDFVWKNSGISNNPFIVVPKNG